MGGAADGVGDAVADGDDGDGHVGVGGGGEAAHVSAVGVVVGVGEDGVEEGLGLGAAGQPEGLVAVVHEEPVGGPEEEVPGGGGLVAHGGEVEEGLAGGGEFVLDDVDGAGGAHRPVEGEEVAHVEAGVGVGCGMKPRGKGTPGSGVPGGGGPLGAGTGVVLAVDRGREGRAGRPTGVVRHRGGGRGEFVRV